jgi:hypothetical protein
MANYIKMPPYVTTLQAEALAAALFLRAWLCSTSVAQDLNMEPAS